MLRPEFEQLRRSLPAGEFGRVVAAERKAGGAVEDRIRRPLFAFLGDTSVAVFDRNPWLFDYPVLITECTFLDDSELERADRVGHTVWSRLRPIVAAHPQTVFILTHFSLRHSDREVLSFFQRERPANVVLWAHPAGHLPEQHQRTRTASP